MYANPNTSKVHGTYWYLDCFYKGLPYPYKNFAMLLIIYVKGHKYLGWAELTLISFLSGNGMLVNSSKEYNLSIILTTVYQTYFHKTFTGVVF